MALRFRVFRQHCLSIAILMATMLGLPSQSYAASPEQRCTDLGANCICSEPLNTTTYTVVPGTNFAFNPADSTTKECAVEGLAGAVYEIDPNENPDVRATNDSTVMNRLPPGHTNSFVLRGPIDNTVGLLFIGTKLKPSDPTARVAIRAYVFYSPTFNFHNDTNPAFQGCNNSGKIWQPWPSSSPGSGPILQSSADGIGWGAYSWARYSPFIDCCTLGPGYDPASLVSSDGKRGRWWRTELIITKRDSGGVQFKAYFKDVTNNGPEFVAWDTSKACGTTPEPPGCGPGTGWTSVMATGLIPPSVVDNLLLDGFRDKGTGTSCTGFAAYAHIMVAGWNTDAGQRIGPAKEIEGGGTASSPSAPGPVNLF